MSKKGKLLRGEKGEELVIEELSKDSSNKRIINNLVLVGSNGMSHQSDHILIRYNGIFVIETKNYYGEIYGNEKDTNWKRLISTGKKVETSFFRNPLIQNNSHIKSVKKIVGNEYPIYGFVVFVKNNVSNLGLFNVCGISEINNRINLLTINDNTPEEILDNIYNKLLYSEADVNQEKHLENIKKVKNERIDHQKELKAAIETRICPNCGNKLTSTKKGLKCPICKYEIKI